MSFDLERLYALLPAVYRIRDVEQGEPLKALLSVIAEQVAVIEEDLAQSYDDHFIETCAQWVVPYIGDLIVARGVHGLTASTFSQRAQVANTLAYRRRKGTAAVLEQLARDATGMDARAVEFFQLLATTQNMNHIRLQSLYSPDLRQSEKLEGLNTPFDELSHTVEVRRIANQRGKYNIPNVGLFLWPLRAYSLTRSPAFRVDDRRWMMSPLGNNMQLFNLPETEKQITHLAEPTNVPVPLGRRMLDRHLATYYGSGKSLLLTVDGMDIDTSQVVVCNLADTKGAWAHQPAHRYGIDPVLGRIAVPTNGPVPQSVQVTFHYGFSADMGGGEYGRLSSFTALKPVVQVPTPHTTIQEAVDAIGTGSGVVEIMDSGRYSETLSVHVSADEHMEIRAADKQRPTLILSDMLEIDGDDGAELTLNGLVISGGPLAVRGKLQHLRIRHCTLVPGLGLARDGAPQNPDKPSLVIHSTATRVEIDHTISGPLHGPENGAGLTIKDSIIDAPTRQARARQVPATISGNLSPFPSVSSSSPVVHVTIGDEGPHKALFTAVPTTLAQARDLLQAAIRASHPSPAFENVLVITETNRLVVLSGAPGHVVIEPAENDPTATELRLDAPSVRQVYALVSGKVSPFPSLSSTSPAVNLTIGTEGPHPAVLASVPNTLAQARDQLEAAIRGAHTHTMFTGARVGTVDDRLVVLPGAPGRTGVFSKAPDDQATLLELALESDRPAIAASEVRDRPGPSLVVEGTTLFGKVHVKTLTLASNVIFNDPVVVEHRQTGCVRFSYLPVSSQVPRPYHCQPTTEDQTESVRPQYTALRYGDAGYSQLSENCPIEISQGADDEAEMGAFHDLYQPQRLRNLQVRLEEYLRFGLEAGVFSAKQQIKEPDDER